MDSVETPKTVALHVKIKQKKRGENVKQKAHIRSMKKI
jgi:hypothetical protein